MFSRLYLEITTCCNRACSFCPGTARPAAFVTPETFRTLAAKLRPYGQYLYLHVMGEPLLHPQLPELLEICRALGFRATLTTNGTLLPKKQEALLAAPALRKVSVSLHSFEANEAGDFSAYLTGCTAFAHAAQKAVSTAAAGMDMSAVRVGPALSQTRPPRLLPANTKSAVTRLMAAPVFQGNSAAQPPIARTATASVSAATAPQGTCLPGSNRLSSDSPRAASHMTEAATNAAAQSHSLSPGQRVPSARPTAPGATNTPSGPALEEPLSVTVPPATWKIQFPRPTSAAAASPGRGSSAPRAHTASPSAAIRSCLLSASMSIPATHCAVKATVLYMIKANEKSTPAAAIGPNSAAAQTASVRKWAKALRINSFIRPHPVFRRREPCFVP